MPVVFVSGYAAEEHLPQAIVDGRWGVLWKPFAATALVRAVRLEIDGTRPLHPA